MRRNSYVFTAVAAITMVLGCAAVAIAKDAVPTESKEVLLDNDQVRVLEVRRSPGAKVPMHTHPPGLLAYYFSAAKVKATLPDGKTKTVDLPAGKVLWYPNELTHAIEIMGTNDQHVLVIQLKK